MRKMQLIVPLRLRKVIFTLMLTIVSSVWMMKAACLMQAPEAMYQPFETVSGTLTSIGFPCEGEEPCPPCLTIALVTDAKTYYLSTSDAQMQAQLDELEMQLPLRATISGTPFVNGSFDFIKVQSVSVDNSLLPSLCDEWNVLEFRSHMGYAPDEYNMRRYHLTTDTIIAGQRYIRLYRDNSYIGAMREGNNRDIYYIPAGTTHEYLLYAFNAQIGDELTDLWLGRTTNEVFTKEYFPYGVNATVEEITETSPRRFVLSTGYITTEEGVENYPYYFEWIEGIGFASAPDGADYPLPYAGGFTSFLLCAYKNGEQIYVSEMGEQYGCEYNYDPYAPSDTIPLFSYTGDDPGSSTVDPVDPNQVVVTLKNDELTIKEFSGETISYQLTNLQSNNVPASRRAPQTQTLAQTQTFQNEVSLTLTEEGRYTLILTNPNWDYSIYGTFNYPQAKDGIDNTPGSSSDTCGKAHKILIDGQLLIEKNNKTYNVLGTPVK